MDTIGDSRYNYETVKKTMLITKGQDARLKHFCKIYRISASQYFRLIIDELRVNMYDMPLRKKMETDSFKMQAFLGVEDGEQPIKEGYPNENNNRRPKYRWIKKTLSFGRSGA